MSWITRCPACATLFKVVPDQLRVSEGWVRCGHCGELFDGQANLQNAVINPPQPEVPVAPEVSDASTVSEVSAAFEAAEVPLTFAVPPVPAVPAAPAAPGPFEVMAAPAVAWALSDAEGAHSEARTWREADAAAGAAAAAEAIVEAGVAEAAQPVVTLTASPSPEQLAYATQESQWLPTATSLDSGVASETPVPSDFAPTRVDEPDEAEADAPGARVSGGGAEQNQVAALPEFVRAAKRRTAWRRPAVRAGLTLVLLALVGVLLAQVALHERNRIAARLPAATPLLQSLCSVLGCKLGPLQQIDALVIDSSSFSKLEDDLYRLSFAVRNSADWPLAAPAMELSLTDTQDRVLLRRVLLPEQLPGAPATVGANGEWSAGWAVSVASSQLDGRIAGYRLLMFYP